MKPNIITATEFRLLSFDAQERFINDGGIVDNSVRSNQAAVTFNSQVATSNGGDNVSASSSEAKEPCSPPVEFLEDDVFLFRDPVEMLYCFDDHLASGQIELHPWQIQFMLDFAHEMHTKEHPFMANVRACNGSGKDLFVVAACSVWLCMRFKHGRAIATNGSGVQLDNQTETHIDTLCNKVNRKLGSIVWKCNYRYYECLLTNSPITLFATDEPLKAEGFHPIVPGGKMGIFASEAKAIPDDIFTALTRCNGFTHRVNVSSPGANRGFFFNKCSESVSRKGLKDIKLVEPGQYIEYHITAYDCPHITKAEIKQMANDMPGGENGDAYKSAVKAEFGSGEEMVVIPYTYIWMATRYTASEIESKWIPEEHNKAGLDLADGGDETVLAVRNGNRLLKVIPFKFNNSEDTVAFLEDAFRENKLTHSKSYIFGDCVGIGKPILDRLKRKGWSNIRYVDSRAASSRPKTYKNYNAQMWFDFAKLLTQKELIIVPDNKLITQLSGRLFKIIDGCVHQLLSKLEMRNKKYPSPDRADATILAFTDYKSTYVSPSESNKPEITTDTNDKPETVVGSFDIRSWAKQRDDMYRGRYNLVKAKTTSAIEDEIAEYNRKIIKNEMS